MKIAMFDSHGFERSFFDKANEYYKHSIHYLDPRLNEVTAPLASGADCVCAFVNDKINRKTIFTLKDLGIRLIALRSAGFNHVDLAAAAEAAVKIVRVPEYSPYAIAEHATALILALNRKIIRANSRIKEGNFSLNGLVGFDLHGKTVGIIGTGKIGKVMCQIMNGFGCRVIAYDIAPNQELINKQICEYTTIDNIFSSSDIISLHLPLTPESRHLIDKKAIDKMKTGIMIINTGRGALIDSKALIDGLKLGKIGYAGLDVYEEEEGIFFEDLSNQVIQDDTLARLLTFPNVILTSHQAFLTNEALHAIAETTLKNIFDFDQGHKLDNEVSLRMSN